jgi:hypothetical protein
VILVNNTGSSALFLKQNWVFTLISGNSLVLTAFQIAKNLLIWDTRIFNFLVCISYSNCSWDFLLIWGDCRVEKKEKFFFLCDCIL